MAGRKRGTLSCRTAGTNSLPRKADGAQIILTPFLPVMSSPPRKRRRTATPAPGPAVPPPPPAPRYDFAALAAAHPDLLAPYLRPHARRPTVDFARAGATLAVTRAILRRHFRLSLALPPRHLVPAVPARAQYLAWAASLVGAARRARPASVLDVGTGPSAIYALLAARTLPDSWVVTATDVDPEALEHAAGNVARNELGGRVVVLPRTDADKVVPGPGYFAARGAPPLALVVCNPPFYDTRGTPAESPPPGTAAQLETPGGEVEFLLRLARDGREHGADVWFTGLVGIKSDLGALKRGLKGPGVCASQVSWVRLSPGARTVRWAVAWRYGV
jgi:23S rRNA A1618 N6-methylase RlmF